MHEIEKCYEPRPKSYNYVSIVCSIKSLYLTKSNALQYGSILWIHLDSYGSTLKERDVVESFVHEASPHGENTK